MFDFSNEAAWDALIEKMESGVTMLNKELAALVDGADYDIEQGSSKTHGGHFILSVIQGRTGYWGISWFESTKTDLKDEFPLQPFKVTLETEMIQAVSILVRDLQGRILATQVSL